MVVDFAKRMEMTVVNAYYTMREENTLTYKSGGRSTEVSCNLKGIGDCILVTGESVARQHWMVVRRMNLVVGEEEEECKGGAENQMMEAQKGSLL